MKRNARTGAKACEPMDAVLIKVADAGVLGDNVTETDPAGAGVVPGVVDGVVETQYFPFKDARVKGPTYPAAGEMLFAF